MKVIVIGAREGLCRSIIGSVLMNMQDMEVIVCDFEPGALCRTLNFYGSSMLSARIYDEGDISSLLKRISEADIVVNAAYSSPETEITIAKSCLEKGIDYITPSMLPKTANGLKMISETSKSNRSCLFFGASFVPFASSVICRKLIETDGFKKLDVFWKASVSGDSHGCASIKMYLLFHAFIAKEMRLTENAIRLVGMGPDNEKVWTVKAESAGCLASETFGDSRVRFFIGTGSKRALSATIFMAQMLSNNLELGNSTDAAEMAFSRIADIDNVSDSASLIRFDTETVIGNYSIAISCKKGFETAPFILAALKSIESKSVTKGFLSPDILGNESLNHIEEMRKRKQISVSVKAASP